MKKSLLLTCGLAATLFAPVCANAQTESVVIEQETVTVTDVESHDYYYSTARDNWFIQLGAGINAPFVENYLPDGTQKHHLSVAYNFAFGKWMSPYLGWRLSFIGGPLHWDNGEFSKAKYASANFDFMWDMCNSIAGVNSRRPVSIIPFVGLGGTFSWDFKGNRGNDVARHGDVKHNQWTLPVSAGVQVRFRCSKYVDLFAEYRAQFYGDNFNNYTIDKPVDVNMSLIGGVSFNIGGCDFKHYNPADYAGYIANLNAQVNDLRGALATTAASLAACEAQLPCPDVQPAAPAPAQAAPLMASVRFRINSSVITNEEQVNVYNIAEWMKANPEQKVTIVGYADKDTGTAEYNKALSQRRAQAVYDMLTRTYGIDSSRLSMDAAGSATQPYPANNDWNRIVIFNNK